MSDPCEVVVERVALGEPLDEHAEHAASCARCRRVAALPAELGATREEADPGIGFAARMTAGAQHRIVVRRRRRVAAGIGAALAVTTLGVFALTREPAREQPVAATDTDSREQRDTPAVEQPDPWRDEAPRDDDQDRDEAIDEDVRALVQLADTDRSLRVSAPWRRIEQPLEPYRIVLEGVEP